MSAPLTEPIADLVRATDDAWNVYRAGLNELATITPGKIVRHPVAYFNLLRACREFSKVLDDPSVLAPDGRVLARVAPFGEPYERARGHRRYVAYCNWPWDRESLEEIDIDAVGDVAARECAYRELTLHYEPQGEVHAIEEKVGWYM